MYFKRKRTFSKVVVRALATGTVLWVGGGGGVKCGEAEEVFGTANPSFTPEKISFHTLFAKVSP